MSRKTNQDIKISNTDWRGGSMEGWMSTCAVDHEYTVQHGYKELLRAKQKVPYNRASLYPWFSFFLIRMFSILLPISGMFFNS